MWVAHGEGIAHMGGAFPTACLKVWIKSCLMPAPPSHSGNASQRDTYCLAGIHPELSLCHSQTWGSQLRKRLSDPVWEGLLWSNGKDSQPVEGS